MTRIQAKKTTGKIKQNNTHSDNKTAHKN